MRNTILSIYQPSHLANLMPTMDKYIKTAFQNLPTSGEEDISFSTLSLKLTTDVLGQAAFGVDFGQSKPPSGDEIEKSEESDFIDEYIDAAANLKLDFSGSLSGILGLLFPVLQKPVHSILSRIPGTMDWKNEQTSQKLSSKLDGIVMKRMKNKDRGSKDFLSLILNAMESEKATNNMFSMDFLSATAYEHLLAGTATTSFTLSSTVYLIADHPEVEKKLVEEIDRFGPPGQVPTPDDLQNKFPYLEQVN